MTEPCGAVHHSGVACRLTGAHDVHIAGEGARTVGWPNADYKAPKLRQPTANQLKAQERAEKLLALKERVRQNRTVVRQHEQ